MPTSQPHFLAHWYVAVLWLLIPFASPLSFFASSGYYFTTTAAATFTGGNISIHRYQQLEHTRQCDDGDDIMG